MKKVMDVAQQIFQKTSTHWGQGKINPATWAWVFRQIDEEARETID